MAQIFISSKKLIKFMKISLKTNLILIAAIFCTMAISSCESNTAEANKETPTEMAEDQNEAKLNGVEEKKADYLVDIAAANLSIIKLSELAEQKTTNDKVKLFATKMIAKHKKINGDINGLAASKNITIPEDMAFTEADGYKDISAETGLEFDKDYSDQISKQHQDFINKLDTTNSNYNDAMVKKFIDEQLPKLRTHIDESLVLKKYLDGLKK